MQGKQNNNDNNNKKNKQCMKGTKKINVHLNLSDVV